MKWSKLLTLSAVVLSLMIVPAIAQGMGEPGQDMQMQQEPGQDMQMQQAPGEQDISLDQFSFEQKDQLVDSLNQTGENISQQIDQARQQNDMEKVSELEDAQQSIELSTSQVQNAEQENWSQVLDQTESEINDLQQYEGVIEREMFEPGM